MYHVLPTGKADATSLGKVEHIIGEDFLHLVAVVTRPCTSGHLIATYMDGGQRHARLIVQPDDLVEDRSIKLVNTGQIDAQHIVGEVLSRPIMRGVGRVLQTEAAIACASLVSLHGLDGSPRMPWSIKLGNHRDAMFPGIAQDLFVLFGGVKCHIPDTAIGCRLQCISFL